MHPTRMSIEEKIVKCAELGEEAYQEWLNQPPIKFPLCQPELPIQNYSSSTSSSHVGDGGNDVRLVWMICYEIPRPWRECC